MNGITQILLRRPSLKDNDRWGSPTPPKPRFRFCRRQKIPSEQTQSPFFSKLPPEVRVQIYQQLFNDLELSNDVHITKSSCAGTRTSRLIRVTCVSKPSGRVDDSLLMDSPGYWVSWGEGHGKCEDQILGVTSIRMFRYNCLSVILSCRKMYVCPSLRSHNPINYFF
jgi:hypothetical protein